MKHINRLWTRPLSVEVATRVNDWIAKHPDWARHRNAITQHENQHELHRPDLDYYPGHA